MRSIIDSMCIYFQPTLLSILNGLVPAFGVFRLPVLFFYYHRIFRDYYYTCWPNIRSAKSTGREQLDVLGQVSKRTSRFDKDQQSAGIER